MQKQHFGRANDVRQAFILLQWPMFHKIVSARMANARSMSAEDWQVLWDEITELFSPGAPVQERDLFAGRIGQLRALIDTVHQRGRHAVVFGERGVGKTSIANILSLVIRSPNREVIAVKVNAVPEDTYISLWKKVFKRLNYENGEPGQTKSIADNYAGDLTIDDVQIELSTFGDHQIPLIVIDEFDRISDKKVTVQIGDTLKALSDYSVAATLVLVGVAEDIGQLLEGHESVTRSIIQVPMPRMTQDELAQIIQSRYAKCGMRADEEAMWKMTFLARGLPYYAQLIGMHAARAAIQSKTKMIAAAHIDSALSSAVAELDSTIKETYHTAVRSPRNEETLYAPVLLACALAKSDEMGEFQQASVTDPLNRIMPGKNYRATTFAFHMNEFCKAQRKSILASSGSPRNLRYRFTDPMMQPFVILKGLADGLISDRTADVYANRRQLQLSTDW
jgi:Cdc6-like AAA superfamily ATPase